MCHAQAELLTSFMNWTIQYHLVLFCKRLSISHSFLMKCHLVIPMLSICFAALKICKMLLTLSRVCRHQQNNACLTLFHYKVLHACKSHLRKFKADMKKCHRSSQGNGEKFIPRIAFLYRTILWLHFYYFTWICHWSLSILYFIASYDRSDA